MTDAERSDLEFLELLEQTVAREGVLHEPHIGHLVRVISSGPLWASGTWDGVPTGDIGCGSVPAWDAISRRTIAIESACMGLIKASAYYTENQWPDASSSVPAYSPAPFGSFRHWVDERMTT